VSEQAPDSASTSLATAAGAPSDAGELIDPAVARAYGVVALGVRDDGALRLAISDTTDHGRLRALRALTGREIHPVRMRMGEIEAALSVLPPSRPGARLSAHPHAQLGGERECSLALTAGVPFVSLAPRSGREAIDPAAAALLDEGFCRHFAIVALATHNDVVVLAAADPTDAAALRAASLMAGREPLVLGASASDIEQAITRSFAPAPRDSQHRPGWRRFGEILLLEGLIDQAQLSSALRLQERTGDALGQVLLHAGVLSEHELLHALSEQLRLRAVRIDPDTLDQDLLALIPRQLMRRHRVVPLALEQGQLVLAMVDPLDDGALASLAEHVTLPLAPVAASDSDIDTALQRICAAEHLELACSHLMRQMPAHSADRVLSRPQRWALILALALTLAALATRPIATIVALNVASVFFFAAFSLYRLRLIYGAVARKLEFPVSQEEINALPESALPIYTVLVPLYREAAVLPRLLSTLAQLDYPPTKLDIKLLVEQDDEETLAALRALSPPPHFRLVLVPHGEPRTKPKACNYGLAQARGEHVVIYDAEDRPEPDQLKKAVLAFAKAGPEIACIQCKLNYYNRDQNLLTRWFTAEYSMWFDLLLPGMHAASAPIPLGGTSNHFITAKLSELGAWDPHNVAEDADLGIRLARRGYHTAIIDSTTFEEATSDIANWTRQRSRWVKGYIQTWLVHMRHPLRLARELGPKGFISFQLLIGGTPGMFLLNPLYWALTSVWTLSEAGVIHSLFPGVAYYAAGAAMYLGNFLLAFAAAAGASSRGHHDLVKYTLISPLYWGLMSLGAWKGLLQLVRRPHYWEKTTHGLDIPVAERR
jgi:cellulose synthase/poly-beta-1,6-N-acetylglucosamine synthase-like glycosyltransferase